MIVDDRGLVAMFGQKQLAVGGKVLVGRMAAGDRVKMGRQAVLLGS